MIVKNSPISVRVRAYRACVRLIKAFIVFASHPPQVVEGGLGERTPSAVQGGLGGALVAPQVNERNTFPFWVNKPFIAPLLGGLRGVSAQSLLDVTVLTDTEGV